MCKIFIVSIGVFILVMFGFCAFTLAEGKVINDICPVMGGRVDKDTPYKAEYKGKTIGLCCPDCVAEFNANPEKYVKNIMEMSEIALPDTSQQHHEHMHQEEHMHQDEHMHTEESMTLSGSLENGVRMIKVEAFRYGFNPDPIIVRRGEKVRLDITSTDVKHGIGIAEYGINVVLPKAQTQTVEFIADKTGDFHIHCTVYCGTGHGNMHGRLKVLE